MMAALERRRSGGDPLPTEARASFTRATGADLADVRIHSDRNSALSAAMVGTRAFTIGVDIATAPSRLQGTAGQGLLAHEVAHVIQQRGGTPGAGRSHSPEDEAESSTEAMKRGEPVTLGSVTPGRLQGFPGDIRTMSVSAELARGLDDADLARELAILDQHLPTLPVGSPEADGVRANKAVLQHEQVQRLLEGPGPSSGADTDSVRHSRFQRAVLLSAQHRLSENRDNLVLWRHVIEDRMSAVTLQTQVLAQSASDLYATAGRTGGIPAFDDWSRDANPFRRNVREHQIRGEWRACTGCHEAVRADALSFEVPHTGPAWTSPADRLSSLAGPGFVAAPAGGAWNADALRVMAAVDAIRPVVAPLGDSGYRIIPDDVFSLRSGQTALELRATLIENIERRRRDYAELSARIGSGDISYLQLTPILNALLPQADPGVQQAVRDEIRREEIFAIINIGGTLILALLSFVFPPLGLALAAIQFAQGYGSYQTGAAYQLGHGAGVFSREQEDSAGALMASGVLNMAMATAVLASAAPGVADSLATSAIVRSDLAVAQGLARRSLLGPIPEAELLQLQQVGLVGRVGQRWANLRDFQVLYRGQTTATSEILSPVARSQGLPASRTMYDAMRAQGMTDVEIAGMTARWNAQPVPAFGAPPGMAGQPLGGVGIPTTRLPNIAADFTAPGGVIYVLRVPKGLAVPAAETGWGAMSGLEQEWVIFHQVPGGMVQRVLPPNAAAPLRFDAPPGIGPALVRPAQPAP